MGQPFVISGEQPKSCVFVPLVVGERATGVISLQNIDREHAFSDADVRLLTTLAGSLSVALENARLFEETRQRNAELALINDVQRGLAENLEMQAMYDLVGDRLQEIFDAQVVDIAILDSSDGLIHFPYGIEKGVRLPDEPIEVIGFRKHVIESREPLLLEENGAELAREYGNPVVLQGEPAKSALFVPLIVGGRATGVISLQNVDREHAFSEADLRLLTTLAASLSVALENARLFEETRQRNAELALINDVQRGLAESLDMQAMYDLVGDRIQQIFDAQVVDIGILDREDGMMHSAYLYPTGRASPRRAVGRHGRHETCSRDTRNGRHRRPHRQSGCVEFGGAVVQGEMVKSAVYVPLIVGGEATGRISLQNIDREHAFSEADVRLLTTLAGSLSVALENARLFEETRQRNAELALINDIQGGLAENLEMQAMYDLIGERIHQIFDAQTVDIGVVDHEAGQIWFPYSLERGERLIDHPIEIMGFRKIALETREPVVVNEDMERRCEEAGNPVAIAGEPSKSSMFVPLFVGSRGSGVISLHNLDREHAFSESDVRLLSTIAGSLSVALENARLFEETRQRNAELALINDVQRGLAEKLEMQAMYDLVGDRIQQIFDAQVVDIGVIDQDARLIRFPYSIERGVRFPDEPIEIMGFRRRVIETRAPVVVNEDVPARSAEEGQPTVLQGEPPMSEVFVPLIVAGRVTGVISLQNLDRESAFSEARHPPAHHDRGEPERRTRERSPLRGDASAER